MDEEPTLDDLIKKEADAVEALSKAFIRFSLARNDVQNALREVRGNLPNVFTGEWDFNESPIPPIT